VANGKLFFDVDFVILFCFEFRCLTRNVLFLVFRVNLTLTVAHSFSASQKDIRKSLFQL
jgi:hypothetical protein